MASHQRRRLKRTISRRKQGFRNFRRRLPDRFFRDDKAQPSFARRFTRRSANSRYFHSSRSHAPNFEIGREVPSYLEFMFRATERDIAHQKCNARDLQNMPSMYNGILQPRISIMTAHKVGEAFPRDPLFRLRG